MKVTMSPQPRVALGIALGFVVSALSMPALAHNVVVDQVPSPDSVVTQSPLQITITTNDLLLDLGGQGSGFAITVTDEQGLYFGDGCVSITETSLSTVVALGSPGSYTISYQHVSADGHPLSDRYAIEFAPPPGHQPAIGTLTPPRCGFTSTEEPTLGPDAESETPELVQPEATTLILEPPAGAGANPWLIVTGFSVAGLAIYALVRLRRFSATRD